MTSWNYVLRVEPDLAFEEVADSVCELLGKPHDWFLESPAEAAAALNLAGIVPGVAPVPPILDLTHHIDRQTRPDGSTVLHGVILTAGHVGPELAVEHAADAIFVADPDTTIRWISDSATDVVGWRPEDLIGRRMAELTHPDDVERAIEVTDRVDAGQKVTLELRSLREDGTYCWLSINGSTVRDESGRILRRVGSLRDITIERASRIALEDSEALARTVIEKAPIGMAVIDHMSGTFAQVNEAMCTFTGRSHADLLGSTWHHCLPPVDGGGDPEEEFLRHLDGPSIRIRCARPDGTVRWGDVSLASALSPTGDLDAIVMQVVDVTDEVAARDQLRTSEQRFRLLAENASDLVFEGKPDWTLAWISPSVTSLLGWKPEELLDRNVVADFVHPDDLANLPQPVGTGLDHPLAYEARFRCADGGYRLMAVTARPLHDGDGNPLGIAGSARDITEWAASRQAVEAVSERLSATLNALLDPLVVLQAIRDDSGRIVDYVHIDANEAAGRHTHRTREQLIGTRMSTLVPGQVSSGLFELYGHVIETGEPLIADAVPYADEMQEGNLRLFDMRGVKVGDAICLNFRDVTDREVTLRSLAESERRFKMLAENASDLVMQHDETIVWVSDALTAVLGWQPSDWVGHSLMEFIPPDDRPGVVETVEAALTSQKRAFSSTVRIATHDGDYKWMSSRVRPVLDPSGNVVSAVISLRDVDEEFRAARSLAQSEALLRAAVTSAPMGVAIVDLDTRITMANPQLSAIVQRDEDWLLAASAADLLHPEELPALTRVWEALLAGTQEQFEGELRLLRSDGTVAWTRCAAVRLPSDEDGGGHFLIQAEDITAAREAQEALAYQTFHDNLTGLRNRAWIVEMLTEDLVESRAHGTRVGVLFIDLDNFKLINDSLGHTAGDEVIGVVAERIQSVLGAGDRIGRFGGDEFVVVVPDVTTATDVERVAERIDEVVRHEVSIRDHQIVPTVSIGIALSTRTSTADDLLRDTDAALFRAKAAGRGRWHFFDQQMHDEAVDRLTLEGRIRQAIDDRQFVVHYQPIVRLRDRRTVGYEALVRWNHPEHGLVPPGDFLPVAEESGLIVPMGQQILEQVCTRLQTLDTPISVNVSAVQLSKRDWADNFIATMDDYGIKPAQLVVEVTETAVLSQVKDTYVDLFRLRDLGVGIHIDDFGTGFSSISLLRDLPVTGLKLDRSFVQNLTADDSQANALAAGLAGLAEGLHLRGIAEGVETDEEWATLLSQGWQYGQGYLFGRPAPLQD